MWRRRRDPEIDRTTVDLDGSYGGVTVHVSELPVSIAASGRRRLVDPDVAAGWLDAFEQQVAVHRAAHGDACRACGQPLASPPSRVGPRELDVPSAGSGPLTVTAEGRSCPACGALHVADVELFFSDFMDAVIDALTSAGVER